MTLAQKSRQHAATLPFLRPVVTEGKKLVVATVTPGRSNYWVWGTVSGNDVLCTVEATNGAEALGAVIAQHVPSFSGKLWRNQRRAWILEHVRLNVRQLV